MICTSYVKAKGAEKEGFYNPHQKGISTVTNTNFDTEKRRGIQVVTFASAFLFYGFKFTTGRKAQVSEFEFSTDSISCHSISITCYELLSL